MVNVLIKSNAIKYDSSAIAFFNHMQGLGDPVPANYKRFYSNFIKYLKSTKGRDLTTSLWDSLDYIRIEATYSKTAALVDLKRLVNATITNDYAGSFTVNVGLKGNGTNFRVNTGFNPNLSTIFLQNYAEAGCLVLSQKTGDTMQEFGIFANIGDPAVYLNTRVSLANKYDTNIGINGTYEGSTPGDTSPTCIKPIGYFSVQRVSSTITILYQNGKRVSNVNITPYNSAARLNGNIPEFCALTLPSTYSVHTDATHGAIWFGNANIEPNLIVKAFQSRWFPFIGYQFSNNVTFFGDSMIGDINQVRTANSLISHYPRKVLTDLGSNWVGQQQGDSDREIYADNANAFSLYTYYSMLLDGYIVPGSPYNQLSFRNDAFTKDVLVFWIGTNDISYHLYSNGEVKGYLDAKLNLLKAQGYKIIVCGIIDRKAIFSGGQNQAGFDSLRADFNNGYLSDFPNSVGTNIYSGGSQADLFVNLYGDVNLQDANNTTYFNADKIHLTTTGFDLVASYVYNAINLL